MPGYKNLRHMGCMASWGGLDWGMKNGAGVNVVYFDGQGKQRTLHAPAVGVKMHRVS
jgi:hypothetical protein